MICWSFDILTSEHNEQSACMISISCAHHGRWYGVLATVGEQLIHFIEISTTSQKSEKTHHIFMSRLSWAMEKCSQLIHEVTLFQWVIEFIWKCKIQERRKDTLNFTLNSTIITITELKETQKSKSMLFMLMREIHFQSNRNENSWTVHLNKNADAEHMEQCEMAFAKNEKFSEKLKEISRLWLIYCSMAVK